MTGIPDDVSRSRSSLALTLAMSSTSRTMGFDSHALSAMLTTIQAICVTAPEVTEGPYYINDEYVRQDIRETQE